MQRGARTLRYKAANTEIDLHFRCPVGGTSTPAELAAAFSHAVLQSLPHGIEVPRWEFTIRGRLTDPFGAR